MDYYERKVKNSLLEIIAKEEERIYKASGNPPAAAQQMMSVKQRSKLSEGMYNYMMRGINS